MSDEPQYRIPTLIFLLAHNKFPQLLKAMLSKPVAQTMLYEYGHPTGHFTSAEQFRIRQDVKRFTLMQLIEIKGSTTDRPRHYRNLMLEDTIRRKLRMEAMDQQTRVAVWLQLTDYYQQPHFYDDLKMLDKTADFVTAIEKDIARTFKSPQIRLKAKQVLQLFAQYNPYVGYCQGMNSIAAFLLCQSLTPAQSFFLLKRVTEQLLPCDYYSNMDNAMSLARIFYQLLRHTHPQVYSHLQQLCRQMDSSYAAMVSFILQWFICLFCNDNVDEGVALVIWDHFVMDGVVVLFKAALAMMDLLAADILKCADFESYNEMQKRVLPGIKDKQYVRKRIQETYICPQVLFLLWQKLMQQPETKKSSKPKPRQITKKCSRKLNVCCHVLENNLDNNYHYECFVFRPEAEIEIIPNYLEKLHTHYFNKQKPGPKKDSLVIGRIPHVCNYPSDTLTEDSSEEVAAESVSLPRSSPSKYTLQSPQSVTTAASREAETRIRERVVQKISGLAMQQPGLAKSESMVFMESMARNASISNILELYDMDQLFQ